MRSIDLVPYILFCSTHDSVLPGISYFDQLMTPSLSRRPLVMYLVRNYYHNAHLGQMRSIYLSTDESYTDTSSTPDPKLLFFRC